jgi:hypothetical protein
MKRFIAVCLATMMILSLALVVYGDEHDGSTDVILNISDSYVTTIPPQVSFGSTMEIEVSGKASSDEVVVFVSSLNYNDTGILCLLKGNKQIEYLINSDNTITSSSFRYYDFLNFPVAELARFNSNRKITLSFNINDSLTSFESGNYSDRLTFYFR